MTDNMQTEQLFVDKYKVTVYEIMPIPYKHQNSNWVQKDRLNLKRKLFIHHVLNKTLPF
jgi:hypothetical protein